MIRPPAFIRRWRKRSRFTPISREDELVNAHNRAQREKREQGSSDART